MRNRKDMYGRPLPATTAETIRNFMEKMGYGEEKEAPVKPETKPDIAPDSPPAPDEDSPWKVPKPGVSPPPKAFRKKER